MMNILLQEDLIIRGGAQLWLMNCGSRFAEVGHKVTFLLAKDSLILDDCRSIPGTKVEIYDREKIAEDPESYREMFTALLTPATVCVTLVRQKRGKFQNVSFMASCIAKANLKTFLIAKTGTPDPTYEPYFYGGDLLDKKQCAVITIANYTRDFIIEKMGIDGSLITNIYNGTDTNRFKRTPEMAEEALNRYPLTDGCFAVGCIGSFVPRKGQSVLLEAAKKLIDDQRIPNIHILMVGEGPDKEMLQRKIEEFGLKNHATLFDFTKEPFYVYERCDVIALPSVGKEGLPNVLLEALAMEKPCVASRIYGCPEVVLDGQTGYCFEAGDVAGLADALANIYTSDNETKKKLSSAGKELVFSEHDKKKQFDKILNFVKNHANNKMTSHEPFGDVHIPFAEPSWSRGEPTPYYKQKHVAWRKKVRDWAQKNVIPFAHKWDEQKNFPVVELRKKAYEGGVLCPWAPTHLGGTPPDGGWDEFMNIIWIEELGRSSCSGVNICLFFIIPMSLPHVLRYGSKELIHRVARPVIRGEAGICITLTEPQGGSDLANLLTTATKTADGKFYIVNGVKKFITGGAFATFFSTLVRTGRSGIGGLSLIIIDANLSGVVVSRLKTQGWWAGNTTLVTFNDVIVPVGNLIGKEGKGFKIMVDVMNWERMIATVGPNRTSRDLLREAISFARQRKTFGKRLIDHQVIRHKIANMARRIEATQTLYENFAFQIQNGATIQQIGLLMALGKVQATQTLEFCAREASQILGGASYLRQGKGMLVERICREIRVSAVGGGSEEILLDLAMRQSKL